MPRARADLTQDALMMSNKKKRTLYLHIGTHKTGTTSFQKFMINERGLMEEHGVYACVDDTSDGNNVKFAHHFIRRSLLTGARIRGDATVYSPIELIRYIASLKRLINTRNESSFVISCEALCFMRTLLERIKLHLLGTALNVRIVPIIVFRNTRDWRASWENQLSKDECTRRLVGRPDFTLLEDWYFNKGDISRFWSAIGTPIQIDYDEAMKKEGDIIKSILLSLGIHQNPGNSYRLNERNNKFSNLNAAVGPDMKIKVDCEI